MAILYLLVFCLCCTQRHILQYFEQLHQTFPFCYVKDICASITNASTKIMRYFITLPS